MRVLRDLSVGRKLALSAGLTTLLLAGMVGIVTQQNHVAASQQAGERVATEARRQSLLGAAAMFQASASEGEALAASDEPLLNRRLGEMRAAFGRTKAALDAALAGDIGGEAAARLAEARAGVGELAESASEAVAARAEMIARRDRALFPRFAELDQAVEAAHSSLQFSMSGEARDEARDVLNTYLTAANEVRMSAQRYLATGDAAALIRTRRAAAQSRVHARRLVAGVAAETRPDMERLVRAGEAVAAEAEAVLALAVRIETIRRDRGDPARDRADAALRAVGEAVAREAASRSAAAHAAADTVTHSVWVAGGIALLLLVLSAWATARMVGTPMRRLAGAVGRIAGGDTAEPVPDQDRRDEVGQIAKALEALRGEVAQAFARQQMIAQMSSGMMLADPRDGLRITYMNPEAVALLRRVEHALPAKAEALLGQPAETLHPQPATLRAILADPKRLPHRERIEFGAEVLELRIIAILDRDGGYVGAMLVWDLATAQARLADRFEKEVGGVVEAVAAAAGQMQDSARTLTASAETSGREADAVAEASGQAGADVQAVAASAEELAASVAEITRQVSEGAGVARAAAEEARATDATVQGLAQAASRIGDVVRLISDIAAQTNLLALNATIEAARAGEAGKGFAVVASEVKSLASQTAKATEEIAGQIGAIQGTTRDAVAALKNIGGTIERLNEVTAAIAAAVEEQGAATREIARSASLVAEGTGAVARRIEDVRAAAGETGRSAGEVLSSAGELAGQAGALREKSSDFLRQVRAQ